MEDTDEFKWALKVVIKRQMRDLMEQLRERGEEIAILTVNLEDNSCSHFGSPNGEWFVSEQKNLIQNFLNFCQTKGKNKRTGYTPSYSYYSPAPAASKKPAGFKQKATPTTPDKSAATSADMPLVKVTVPRHLAGDISEEELAGLVGRIVATQLVMQEKGDGSTGGTKFDLLLDAANQSKSKDELSSVMSTPSTRSTRKRKVTAKFREGINSLKKGKKSEEEEDVSEQEASHEDSMIFKILAELSSATLKRVRVKLSDETTVDVEHSMLTSSEKFESLAVQVIQELDEVASGLLTNKKNIKIEVYLDSDASADDRILIEVEDDQTVELKQEPVLEENNDDDFEENLEFDEEDDGDSDMEETLPVDKSETNSLISFTKSSTSGKKSPKVLKKREARKSCLSKTLPFPCEHCGKNITGRGNLIAHIKRVHLKEKEYKCIICPKAFNTGSALECHMLAVHTRRCESCHEYVVESEPWPEGMDMKKKRNVTCKCGAVVEIMCKFGRKREYEEEDTSKKRRYNDQTQYACSHCGKLFTRKSHCLRHTRMHTGVKDIQCTVCGEKFRYENSLRRHLQIEHPNFDCTCFFCDKKFQTSEALAQHCTESHPEAQPKLEPEFMPVVVAGSLMAAPKYPSRVVQPTTETSTQSVQVAAQNEGVVQNQVTVSMAEGESMDTMTYHIVQHVLQENDQMFTEDGKTVIVRTLT